VLIGYAAAIERLLQLPPGAFRPAPKVHSSVVRLAFRPPLLPARDPARFALLVRSVFSRRRKTLANALAAYPALDPGTAAASLNALGIDPTRRPETLAIEELVTLSNRLVETEEKQRRPSESPVL
jgi:16S rRNA (adenine1518-N6/adenine1519-N6)-dimethyltransferase